MAVNVRDKLAANGYENKLPYPHGSVRSNRPAHEAFRAENRRLTDEFKMEALDFVGLKDHPKADKIWNKAWSDRHSYGYHEVLDELEELADIVVDNDFIDNIKKLMWNHCPPGCSHEGCSIKNCKDYTEAVNNLEKLGFKSR
jgi:hypothetical protein